MLLRHRPADNDLTPAILAPGLQHLDQHSVAVLRRLIATRLDFVLVGPVAHAIRGELTARGAVTIVPAPYLRNQARLTAARSADGRGFDVVGCDGVRYQELLYEAARFQVAPAIEVHVASPEDLEHFSHLQRTGSAPEFRITRAGDRSTPEPQPADSSPNS
jgi:hypothetical protein